jgi:hypothetical protein
MHALREPNSVTLLKLDCLLRTRLPTFTFARQIAHIMKPQRSDRNQERGISDARIFQFSMGERAQWPRW